MSDLVLKRPLVFFDLETTGVDTSKDRIVQFAAIKYFKGYVSRQMFLINPERPIPKEATAVHGISNDDIAGKPTFAKVAYLIYSFIKDCDVCTYNGRRFDVPLLWRQLTEAGRSLPLPLVVDCFSIFKKQLPHKLEAAHKYYVGFDMSGAHDAMADTEATARVFFKQLAILNEFGVSTVEEMSAFCDVEGQVDLAGKLKRTEYGIVLTFGKHRDVPIMDVPKSYLRWCLKENMFAADALEILQKHGAL